MTTYGMCCSALMISLKVEIKAERQFQDYTAFVVQEPKCLIFMSDHARLEEDDRTVSR